MRSRPNDADPWASATWEGAESEMLTAGARMSLPERLRWLEEASRAARALTRAAGAVDELAAAADSSAPTDTSRI